MDKKRTISWGVSFGSLALVAGMVSFLGLSSGTSNQNNQLSSQNNLNSQRRYQQDFGNSSSSAFGNHDNTFYNNGSSADFGSNDNSFYDNGSSDNSGNNDPSYNDNGQSFNNNDSSFGHQGGFDTTTGGT
ncbi:MAG: hypothetical protein Q8934_22935 [Bacillota bacterium]|nr:hypothetical protein [Bacillota bacterium]